jgi:hypothetical protein
MDVPILGQQINGGRPEMTMEQARAAYNYWCSMLAAVSTLLKPLPLDELVEMNKRLAGPGMLAVPPEQYAAVLETLRTDQRVISLARQWQGIVKAGEGS